jgi:V-type H+-transporting ATPase subunit H
MRLLDESIDPVVLAVAVHDIGQYVKYYDRGKKSVYCVVMLSAINGVHRIVTDLGAKTRVMELMSHEDSNVRYQALLSVQLLVSHPWSSA